MGRLAALRPGQTFGAVVKAMQEPLRKADAENLHPLIHSMNPMGPLCSFGAGFARLPGSRRYGRSGEVPTFGEQVLLRPGMTFSVEPSCMLGRRCVNLGGTVVVGEKAALEINRVGTRMMHVG